MQPLNPWLTRFFNVTAGLEKVIIGAAAVAIAYVQTGTDWSDPKKTAVSGMIGLIQILYTANTTPATPGAAVKPAVLVDKPPNQ